MRMLKLWVLTGMALSLTSLAFGQGSFGQTPIMDVAYRVPVVNAPAGYSMLPANGSSQLPLDQPGNTLASGEESESPLGCGAACGSGCGMSCGCGKADCNACGGGCCCENAFWAHRTGGYGDYLYLHCSNADIAHALQQNGTGGAGTVPEGHVGVVDLQYQSGYRAGFWIALDQCSSVGASFTQYRSHARDSLAALGNVGSTVQSLVIFPGTINTGITNSLSTAQRDVDFQFVDIDTMRLATGNCNMSLNYVLGLRYANLQQGFSQLSNYAQQVGVMSVNATNEFESLGTKFGFDSKYRLPDSGLTFYGKGFLSLLFGEFKNDYRQYNITNTTTLASSNWQDDRVVPILDYELGLGWSSCDGRLSLSTGYYTAFWFNTIATGSYIQAVQNQNFVNVHQTMVFDGFVARAEYKF